MGEVHGRLYFAPDIPMEAVPLEDPDALLEAVERRIDGLFVAPIRKLQEMPESEIGALFAAALLVAALIEAVARMDGDFVGSKRPIAAWLEARVLGMDEEITIQANPVTVASVFETRFRHALAHQGYVASRGRLSREVEGVCQVDGDIVTMNPFELLTAARAAVGIWLEDLRSGSRSIKAFQHRVREQFSGEVEAVRQRG